MSIGIIFVITSLILITITLAYPLINSYMNPPQKKLLEQYKRMIDLSTHTISCEDGEDHLIYTYQSCPCSYSRITLERRFINGKYIKSHQVSGDIKEAMGNRIENLERLELEENPVVTGLS